VGWEELVEIVHDTMDIRQEEKARAPQACPKDGEPLLPTPDGLGRYCQNDGWQWPRDDWSPW
jgi:hypothetical protein